MVLVDARRLTGPNLLSRAPLVIVELTLDPTETMERALDVYRSELGRMRVSLGFPAEIVPVVRAYQGGAVFGYEAPIDVMVACAEMSEWAATSAVAVLASHDSLALEPARGEIAVMLEAQRSPRKLALVREARIRGLPFRWDDDRVGIGEGRRSVSFANDSLPDATSVAWDKLGAIPTALVTGTNGKTTSARLLARVGREAGLVVGSTSTDGITVGSETLESGDWTGPAAARIVLGRTDVDLAVLETARGGILRRGLGLDACDAALITNVSDDHLGLYGIDDVAAMTRVKAVAAEIVRSTGTVILNASDKNLVDLARGLAPSVTFFADLEARDDGAASVVEGHRAAGKHAVFTRDGVIVCARGEEERALVRVSDVPITFDGAARYNVENVLGVVATARALGLADDAIVRAVSGFGMADNPRRGELIERRGVRVFVDFGHNPEAVRAALRLVLSLQKARPGRLTIVTGSAGDRTDHEITDVAQAVFEARPDRVFVRELPGYLRGRAPGEVPALLRRALLGLGLREDAFAIAPSEVDALRAAFKDARAGDLVALLIHLDHEAVHAFLDAQG